MRLRNLRIGTRLGIGFGILLLILMIQLSIVGIISARNSNRLKVDLAAANDRLQLATNIRTALLQAGLALRNIGLQTDLSAMQREEDLFNALQRKYRSERDRLTASGLAAADLMAAEKIDRLQKDMEAPLQAALADAHSFNAEGAAKIIAEKIDPMTQQSMAEINHLVDSQQAQVSHTLEVVSTDSRMIIYLSAIVGLMSLIIGGSSAFAITRSIVGPLKNAVAMAKRVALGELTPAAVVKGRDEICQLLNALAEMNHSLIATVGEVRAASENIKLASREIAAGNGDLSIRTEAQAASLRETASSMEELTSAVQLNAENSGTANRLVETASRHAVNGGVIVAQVVSTMDSIKESSRRIVDIISVIDGIAFQTNILALNAAVEAARAGEQGRGFAVVASEVRNLAQRSAVAAREIKTLISDSVVEIDAGAELVEKSGGVMDEIVLSVNRVTQIMGDIARAGNEQSKGIREVNTAITAMDEITQQNMALVEQAAAAAESMSTEALRLGNAVAVFKMNAPDAAQADDVPAVRALFDPVLPLPAGSAQ